MEEVEEDVEIDSQQEEQRKEEQRKEEQQEIVVNLDALVETLLFASGEPVAPERLCEIAGCEQANLAETLNKLKARCDQDNSGIELRQVAGKYQLRTKPDYAEFVRQLKLGRPRRLSPAALETLAIVAYRQPVTAPEIQSIRGKDPTAAIKGLLDKKLIRCLGHKKVVGHPLLYGTSKEFLTHFGLDGLGDLPSIEEFDQFLEVLEQAGLPPADASAELTPLALALEAPSAVPGDDA